MLSSMKKSKQSKANKRNAQQSTGPRSSQGMARSSWNATRHGAASMLSQEQIDEARELLRLDEIGIRNAIAKDNLAAAQAENEQKLEGRAKLFLTLCD